MVSVAQPALDKSQRTSHVPWYLWCATLAVTSAMIGGRWDVSWHESIGRDTFWTPAHMAIYLCGVLAGVVCGYLILSTTFRRTAPTRAVSVRVLGFRGPLGAFLAAWGGVAMLTSAPFDNWWHNAYGLDVKIVSPPHTLLMLGSVAVLVGSLFLVLAAMNRAAPGEVIFRQLRWLLLYLCGLLLLSVTFFCTEYVRDVLLHTALPYIAVSIGVPLCYAVAWKASRYRWASTWIATMYVVVVIAFILILPLFPAEPKLGPVYQPVTHFVPSQFPLLLIVPAVLLDLLWTHFGHRNKILTAIVSGPVFVLSLVAVEWPFANFLMTKGADNRFFATGYHPYAAAPWSPGVTRHFVHVAHGRAALIGIGLAMLCAAISTWLGTTAGAWMQKVRR